MMPFKLYSCLMIQCGAVMAPRITLLVLWVNDT